MATVLVTGAAGYIGSHACVELLGRGHDVIGIDNFDNSSPVTIDRIGETAGRPIVFHELDLRDRQAVHDLFAGSAIDAVMHFAGRKAVGESVAHPQRYYEHNVVAAVHLFGEMAAAGVRTIVFSSSCTVYGDPASVPVDEAAPLQAINPYGRTKLIIEDILRDLHAADPGWRIALLRYFNPIGAHPGGRLGENPLGIPNNLMPHVMRAALGQAPAVRVFGGDYPTPDGTCIRDYIHVVDLVEAHVAALELLATEPGVHAVNLGTGRGVSVLELIGAVARAVGHDIAYEIAERRAGDAVGLYADPGLAQRLLGWTATRTLDDMCRDHWNFQRHHPDGY